MNKNNFFEKMPRIMELLKKLTYNNDSVAKDKEILLLWIENQKLNLKRCNCPEDLIIRYESLANQMFLNNNPKILSEILDILYIYDDSEFIKQYRKTLLKQYDHKLVNLENQRELFRKELEKRVQKEILQKEFKEKHKDKIYT